MSELDHVRSYYEALNTGDAEQVSAHFTEDAVHYYTRLGPHEGGKTIGEHAAWAVANIDGQWYLEHGIEADGEVVIEWTMTWREPASGRAPSRPRHRVVRLPRRADHARCAPTTTAGARTPGGPARLRPRRPRLHDDRGLEGALSVIKDSGARALLPPFGEEHEELRQTVRRFVARGDRAPRPRVGGGAGVPARAVRALRRARLPRPQVPGGVRRAGRHPPPRRRLGRGAGPLRRLGRGRCRPQRPRLDRDAAGL